MPSRPALSLVGLMMCLSASLAAQGPIDGYVKARGELDLALGLSLTGADRFAGGPGERFDFPFSARIVGGFAAYGLTDRLNVVASVPLVVTDADAGLQDGALFAKGLIARRQLRRGAEARQWASLDLIGALGVQAPLSRYEVVAAGAIGQRARLVQPRLVAQLNGRGYFASILTGYNYRFDGLDAEALARIQRTRPGYRPEQPHDFVNVLLRAGIPTSKLYVDAWLEFQRTLGGEDFVEGVEELPQAYRVDYRQVGGTVYYSESAHWGFAVAGAAVIGGRNTSLLRRATATVVYKL